MAVSVYDKTFLSEDDQRKLSALTEEWERANAAGDEAGMESAHAAAEDIRRNGGSYAGGDDGTQYTRVPGGGGSGGGYTAAKLPVYQAQTEAVNDLYDAAREAQLTELRAAYEKNVTALEQARDAIPERYQLQRNAAGAQSELARQNFQEYAAASGLNSGTGGQAELSRRNALQGELAALGREEAMALTEADNKLADLKRVYQNDVASAVAKGELERAAALLEEYRQAARSAVSTAVDQASENWRAYSSAADAEKQAYERLRDEEESAYQRLRDEEESAYQRRRDEEKSAYERERDALEDAWQARKWEYEQEQDEREWAWKMSGR